MSRGDYDDRDDRFDDRDRDDRRGGSLEVARRKVSTPGMLLILTGLLGLVIEIGFLAVAFTNPNAMADAYQKYLIDAMPAGQQKDDVQKQFDAEKAGMRLDTPFNIGSIIVGAAANLLSVVGGIKMRGLSGYGLSMAGAIVAIIPMGGCCCATLPVGVWALIVLVNADVKRAFGRGAPEPRDDFDDRGR